MPRVELDLETPVPPDRIVAALTDFTDRRPDIWPGISRSWYEVYSVGDRSADIREGTGGKRSSIWAKEHYDWSTPGLVTWTVRESGFCAPGSFGSAKVDPTDGGGSKVHITWQREPTTAMAKLISWFIKATNGMPVASSFKRGLARVERQQAGAG